FGIRPFGDLRAGRSLRNSDREFDEEFHERLLPTLYLRFAPTGTEQAPVSVGYHLSHRCFDDGNVLFRRSAADSDAGDHLALAGERHAAAHRGVPTAGDREERIKVRA